MERRECLHSRSVINFRDCAAGSDFRLLAGNRLRPGGWAVIGVGVAEGDGAGCSYFVRGGGVFAVVSERGYIFVVLY